MTAQPSIEETYARCLAAVAPREVMAAKAMGAYENTWTRKPHTGVEDTVMRARILDALSAGERTTVYIRARTQASRQATYQALCSMETTGQVKSRLDMIDGRRHTLWRLAGSE